MKSAKKFICILTALLLVCAMALPAFAEGETQYNEHDVAKLRAFFEQEDPHGVKNGNKLFFDDYDPDDPSTWDEWAIYCGEDVPRVGWDENGRVTVLCLGREEEQLYGKLDISGMDELTFLECGMSKLTEVNCSGCAKLMVVELSQNEIESINLSGCTSIELLNVASNKLKALDFDDCRGTVTDLWIDNNEIGELDLSGMPNIEVIIAYRNKLTSITVPEECTNIRILDVQANQITEAEINADVHDLRFNGNPITKLDVTASPNFLELAVANCPLTELHMAPDGNRIDIVSDGHGTFGGYVLNNVYDHETEEYYDGLHLTGVPDEGYEYMGLYMDGELMFEPNEDYDFDDMPAMSLTAVFSGSEPEPSEPDPSEPAPIAPPVTGGASLVFLGVISIMGGAAAVCLRRRGN